MSKSAVALGEKGERMVPEIHEGLLIYSEHYIRYIAGQELVKGKTVLDIASGSGYGTKILAETAKKVYGVEIDKKSVEYAQNKYGASNIEFKVGDGENIPLPNESVDVVITYETIEHIKNYKKFVEEMSRVLKKDGLAIVSTPNDLEFAEGNHFHLHEFAEKELNYLLKNKFKNIKSYYQATWKYVALGSKDELNASQLMNKTILNHAPVKPKEYLYFYLLCSNREIQENIEYIGALGEHYSERYYIGQNMQHEKNIENYITVQNELKLLNTELISKNDILNKNIAKIQKEIYDITKSKGYIYLNKVRSIKNRIINK